ncbi:MAG: carotenoid biosynthesis protein [Candidatus Thorarchaeota archaeon]|nr:carotenoid biosynthesis protein [Candidatus Thorarchaeota archaeon]
MNRFRGIGLTILMMGLSTLTSFHLWWIYGLNVAYQVIVTLLIATLGEHLVSGQGYYYYTKHNGLFIGNVPLWIPFMWVFTVQVSMISALTWGLPGLAAAVGSGLIASLVDFAFLEPYFSRQQGYWIWQSVERGYFRFVPKELHRFTAPPGNYITWFLFPTIMNVFLVLLSTL